jgi:hypothetical protein
MTTDQSGALVTGRRSRAQDLISGLLIAIGLSGLVLFGTIAFALHGWSGPTVDVESALTRAETTIADAAATARKAGEALDSTSGSASSAAAMLDQLAATMRVGANSLRLDILGSQPFTTVADSFDVTADQAAATATQLTSTATGVAAARVSLDGLATDLDGLAGATRALETEAGQLAAVAGWRDVAVLALAWIASVGAVMALAGVVRWRATGTPVGSHHSGTLPVGR